MLNGKAVFDVVAEEIRNLLEDDLDSNLAISPADSLHELALNSLLLARLIIALEMETGVDPFADAHSIADVRTVGDLAHAYEDTIAVSTAERV